MPGKDKIYCPITAIQNWLSAANFESGALFRGLNITYVVLKNQISEEVFYNLIKNYDFQLNFPLYKFSQHSIRAGFVTIAYENKAILTKIIEQAHIKNMQSSQRYIRHTEHYKNHAGQDLH